jgi:catechol 2,3-dioxygenase-like lactoylglutathione lyase family enzyme
METAGIHHVAINVHDLDEALGFYVDRLGFSVLDRPPFDFPGAWLQAGASQIHLMETSEATIDRRQHLALRVDDLEDVLGELAAAGVEAARVPYTPGAGQQAFLRDPSGNRIELNQPDRT